jgi:hypothetical protein
MRVGMRLRIGDGNLDANAILITATQRLRRQWS